MAGFAALLTEVACCGGNVQDRAHNGENSWNDIRPVHLPEVGAILAEEVHMSLSLEVDKTRTGSIC